MTTRLISFLGTSDYQDARYRLDGEERVTCYVAHAIADILGVDEVDVLATPAAGDRHEASLRATFAGGCPLRVRNIPDGQNEKELWKMFEVVQLSIGDGSPENLIIDITHGFRAQPFFTASALALLRMSDALPSSVRVLYGQYRQTEPSPIWDLTVFFDLLGWAHGAAVLASTGHGGPLLAVLRRQDRATRSAIAGAGETRFPHTGPLINAIERFTADLATVRIAALVTGYEQDNDKKHVAVSSAKALATAIGQYENEVREYLPALLPLLRTLADLCDGIGASTLCGETGHKAVGRLADLYRRLERYPEAAAVVREGWVSRFATGAEGCEVNSLRFDDQARAKAERLWSGTRWIASARIAEIRNDIGHGGFRKQPLAPAALQKRIDSEVAEFTRAAPVPAGESRSDPNRVWFISRHVGAREWIAAKGIVVDQYLDHLDIERVAPGDTVIGTLPINLAAEVCRRGASYQHLSLDLPSDARGKELTADELDLYGARLTRYHVEAK